MARSWRRRQSVFSFFIFIPNVFRTLLFRTTVIFPSIVPTTYAPSYAAIRHIYDIRRPNRNHPDTSATTDAIPADRYPDTRFEIAADRFL